MEDLDILKTLQSIEKLLKGSMAGAGRLPDSSVAGASRTTKPDKNSDKVFTAVTATAKSTASAMLGLTKSLSGLDEQVSKTTVNFSSLNAQLSRLIGTTQQNVKAGAGAAAAAQKTPTGMFGGMLEKLTAPLNRGAAPTAKSLETMQIPFKQVLGAVVDKFGNIATALGGAEVAFASLWQVVHRVTGDFLQLSRTGMGSMQNLGDLYINAAKAGMSLKEYTKMIDDNMSVVARSGSLDAFDKMISGADKQLASMGIFGSEARQLQASLAQSSSTMGTSINDISGSIKTQVSAFDELHRSTNMTADAFAKLMHDMANDSRVQHELLGLAPEQREARKDELFQMRTFGERLGLTSEQSGKLTEALMAQRASSFSDKLDQRSAILQASSSVGMAGGVDLAQLVTLARPNEAQKAQMLASAQELNKLMAVEAEAAAQSNNGARIQQLIDMRSALDKTAFGQIMNAATPAQLAQDSGKVNQSAFKQSVGEFGQAVGMMTTWARGFSESILGPLAIGIGGVLIGAFKGKIVGLLKSTIGLGAGAGRSVAAGLTPWPVLDGAPKAASGLASVIEGPMATLKGMFALSGETVAGGSKVLGGSLKMFSKILGPAALLVDSVMEMFTGNIASALNPSGGFFNRLNGMVVAFFTGIPNLIIDVFGYIFGDSAGQKVQHYFDLAVAAINFAMRKGFEMLFGDIIDVAISALSFFTTDSKLFKNLKSSRDNMRTSTDEGAAVVENLWTNTGTTLGSISKANKAAAAAATTSGKAAVDATAQAIGANAGFSAAQTGIATSAAAVLSDARTIQGTPQVQVPPAVAPAAVNTGTTNAAPATSASTANGTDMASLLAQILAVMRDNLAAEVRQAENTDALLRSQRTSVSFADDERVSRKLIKGTA